MVPDLPHYCLFSQPPTQLGPPRAASGRRAPGLPSRPSPPGPLHWWLHPRARVSPLQASLSQIRTSLGPFMSSCVRPSLPPYLVTQVSVPGTQAPRPIHILALPFMATLTGGLQATVLSRAQFPQMENECV